MRPRWQEVWPWAREALGASVSSSVKQGKWSQLVQACAEDSDKLTIRHGPRLTMALPLFPPTQLLPQEEAHAQRTF